MSKKKNRKNIPDKTKIQLWVKSGGRCQFKGCNDYLLKDDLSYADMNNAHIAHIIDVNPKTHRFSNHFNEDEKNELWNLMLLCQKHHRLIDNEEEKNYSIEKLKEYKKQHEDRILNLTSIKENVKTNVIFYFSKIGKFQPSASFDNIRNILSKKSLYPASSPIEIGSKNSAVEDNESLFWQAELKNLELDFERKIVSHYQKSSIKHFSLFALAPQPLLIKFGTLLPDLYTVDVYQKHREPDTWEWQEKSKEEDILINKPTDTTGIPVLNISLSASIDNGRITPLFNKSCSIWTLIIKKPNNNFLTNQKTLENFRTTLRFLFDKIKNVHGHDVVLSVFPCMPNSASIEFGRVWMPKADLSLDIYDERNGFKKALTIKRK